MGKQTRNPKEVRDRTVHMVFEHEREYSSQWTAITSIATLKCQHTFTLAEGSFCCARGD